MTYSRAGHPYPILIRPAGQVRQLEVKGALLGVFEGPEYNQKTIQLYRGDKMLLYSDGAEPFIGSFDDLSGFAFSEEFCRIRNLPITAMMDKFKKIIKTHKDKAFGDDVTMVGVEIL